MDRDNKILANIIANNNDRLAYDEVCKQILAEKYIVAKIMKYTLPEYKDYSLQDIVSKYIDGVPEIATRPVHPNESGESEFVEKLANEDSLIHEGRVTYDIMFKAIIPENNESEYMYINLEGQKAFNVGYPIVKRGIYYGGRMLSSQYGKVFTQSHYEKIKKVRSIFICNNVTDKKYHNTITCYEMSERNIFGEVNEDKDIYDLLTVIIVCFNEKENNTNNELINMMSVLFSRNIKADKKLKMLSSEYGIPVTTEIEKEVNSMCNFGAGLIEQGFEEGIERGIEEGIEQGIEQGIELTKIESIAYLISKKHWDITECFEMYNIPKEDEQKYIDAVNKLIKE